LAAAAAVDAASVAALAIAYTMFSITFSPANTHSKHKIRKHTTVLTQMQTQMQTQTQTQAQAQA